VRSRWRRGVGKSVLKKKKVPWDTDYLEIQGRMKKRSVLANMKRGPGKHAHKKHFPFYEEDVLLIRKVAGESR